MDILEKIILFWKNWGIPVLCIIFPNVIFMKLLLYLAVDPFNRASYTTSWPCIHHVYLESLKDIQNLLCFMDPDIVLYNHMIWFSNNSILFQLLQELLHKESVCWWIVTTLNQGVSCFRCSISIRSSLIRWNSHLFLDVLMTLLSDNFSPSLALPTGNSIGCCHWADY